MYHTANLIENPQGGNLRRLTKCIWIIYMQDPKAKKYSMFIHSPKSKMNKKTLKKFSSCKGGGGEVMLYMLLMYVCGIYSLKEA